MATKHDLRDWVHEALQKLGGSGRVVDVAKQIWADHADELRNSDDLFFTWQYDMRWAAYRLRKEGVLKPANDSVVPWELA